jgi:hypothetical protein
MPLDTARAMLYLALQRPTERTTRSRLWTMAALRLGK